MGLGLLGRGVGDALFLAKSGAELTITDLKTEEQLASSLRRLKKFKNVRYVLGRHDLEDFQKGRSDMVIKAAGVPLNSPFIQEAEKQGVPVFMSTALFAKLTPAWVMGVTGTRGKSTVTDMLAHILRKIKTEQKIERRGGGRARNSDKGGRGKVFVGGNVLGVSTLALLPKVKFGDTALLELDSWQLQGFDGFSPHLAIFTTFMPDHLNYYGGSMERYFADKANIYRFQNKDDVLVMSRQVAQYIKKYGPRPKARIIIVDETALPTSWKVSVPGKHNRLNAALATAAAQALGVDNRTIRSALTTYKGLPGRLELVRTHKGVAFFNDTNATTEDATIAALQAFRPDKKTILIFGGADKKLEHKKLFGFLAPHTKALVILPGTGTDIIRPAILRFQSQYPTIPVMLVSSMKEAVVKAFAQAKRGDRVMMSPGFASFGLFKNEYDRGDQFNAQVKKI